MFCQVHELHRNDICVFQHNILKHTFGHISCIGRSHFFSRMGEAATIDKVHAGLLSLTIGNIKCLASRTCLAHRERRCVITTRHLGTNSATNPANLLCSVGLKEGSWWTNDVQLFNMCVSVAYIYNGAIKITPYAHKITLCIITLHLVWFGVIF